MSVNAGAHKKSTKRKIFDALMTTSLVLVVWQITVILADIPRFILPGPFDIGKALIHNHKIIWENAVVTFTEVIAGMFLGVSVGVLAAIGLMMFPLAQRLIMPLLIFSQSIPIFALAPIITLWLGYGIGSKVAVTILMIFFPVASTFLDGLRNTDQTLTEAAAGLGAKPLTILMQIRIPAAFPSLASGLTLAAVYAPIGAILGEWVGASKGLGYLMLLANGRAKIDLMFAALFVLSVFTMLLYISTSWVARRLAAWPLPLELDKS